MTCSCGETWSPTYRGDKAYNEEEEYDFIKQKNKTYFLGGTLTPWDKRWVSESN